MEEICDFDGHTVHKLSQRHLTADWLAPGESDCSRIHSKVSSDWLPSYIKATRPVLEVFKMDWHFPDSPRTLGTRVQFIKKNKMDVKRKRHGGGKRSVEQPLYMQSSTSPGMSCYVIVLRNKYIRYNCVQKCLQDHVSNPACNKKGCVMIFLSPHFVI
jgi:hypothetical protein